ncbi:MAG: prenyltransferase/squalene oxidase repeat-containing protein [Candidatus Hodarchaeota archaeon]
MVSDILKHAATALGAFLNSAVPRHLEVVRVAQALYALAAAGCSTDVPIIKRVTDYVVRQEQPDGGWSDPEETAWASGAIRLIRGRENPVIQSAVQWLDSVRRPMGGWGRHPRDQARIPITALISALVPEVIKAEDIEWLIEEWRRDFEGPVRLSYKAGFFLLVVGDREESHLVAQTVSHLAQDQNEDGGFAAWKGHPIGSDPWSTGIVLWGLSKWIDHVDARVFEKTISWLGDTQLPSGYWSYHYLDEGTSLALIGAVAALKALVR